MRPGRAIAFALAGCSLLTLLFSAWSLAPAHRGVERTAGPPALLLHPRRAHLVHLRRQAGHPHRRDRRRGRGRRRHHLRRRRPAHPRHRAQRSPAPLPRPPRLVAPPACLRRGLGPDLPRVPGSPRRRRDHQPARRRRAHAPRRAAQGGPLRARDRGGLGAGARSAATAGCSRSTSSCPGAAGAARRGVSPRAASRSTAGRSTPTSGASPRPSAPRTSSRRAHGSTPAAIPLMNRPPSITNEQQALRNAGWTLPVASSSVIVLMLSLAFAFAPSRRKPQANAQTEPRA